CRPAPARGARGRRTRLTPVGARLASPNLEGGGIMDVGIRDDTLLAGGFSTIAEGVVALEVASVELVYGREGTVRSLAAAGETLNLDSEAGREALRSQCATSNARVSALMMANNFNAPDLAAEVDWVRRAAEAAQALGIPALRIDSIMRGERELSLD